MKNRILVLLATIVLLSNPHPPAVADGLLALDDDLVATMDELRFAQPKEKGTAELVAGKFGKAVRFHFDQGAQSTFFTSNIRGSPEWDHAVGFSFWVKGDGIDGVGCLQFIYDDDYSVRYDVAFPVKGTEWTMVSVGWDELIPVLPGPKARPFWGPDGNKPSKISALWFGKWWYWGDYPALTFTVDDIRLQAVISGPGGDESGRAPAGEPLARVREKLRAGRPITVVTMGDSLTDKRHWANREVAWVDLLKDRAKAKYGSDVSIVNPAVGGTQLRQNLVMVPVWLDKTPEPDLVTVFFGGNDWDSGMRGEEFERAVADAIVRIRRVTKGKADVLILTTNPAASRWDAIEELAEACRKAARSHKAGLADTDKAFHEAGRDDRDRLFVRDRVHLSKAGHEIVAEAVLKAIESGGR